MTTEAQERTPDAGLTKSALQRDGIATQRDLRETERFLLAKLQASERRVRRIMDGNVGAESQYQTPSAGLITQGLQYDGVATQRDLRETERFILARIDASERRLRDKIAKRT